MSSIGSNIPNAGNDLRIENDNSSQGAKQTPKQQSTSQIAQKALGQLKEGLSKIDLSKHLSSLKQVSSGVSNLATALFEKIFPKPLMNFEGMEKKSPMSQIKEALANLGRAKPASGPVNLMDQDMKADLHDMRQKLEQNNQELNKALGQLLQKRTGSKGSEHDVVGIPLGLPKVKIKSQERRSTSESAPSTPKFSIKDQSSAAQGPTADALKEAASKLKLGGDFKTMIKNAKKQIDDNKGEAHQVKKKLTDAKEMLQTAKGNGLVDKASAKEVSDHLNFFDKMTAKNLETLDEMKKNLDDWTIPANYGK